MTEPSSRSLPLDTFSRFHAPSWAAFTITWCGNTWWLAMLTDERCQKVELAVSNHNPVHTKGFIYIHNKKNRDIVNTVFIAPCSTIQLKPDNKKKQRNRLHFNTSRLLQDVCFQSRFEFSSKHSFHFSFFQFKNVFPKQSQNDLFPCSQVQSSALLMALEAISWAVHPAVCVALAPY